MMLGVLLARAGVKVLVLEKHQDFLRDFRGDTIHPSTLQVMDELGWLDDLLRLPHQKVEKLSGQFGDTPLTIADMSHLPVKSKFIALMPQWDFLDFLADKGRAYPGFDLKMNAEALDLVSDGGRVTGVKVRTDEGPMTVNADLVVAADGRSSTLRKAAGFVSEDFGAPMDVMWFRLPRLEGDTDQTQARFDAGHLFVMLQRGDYWQCAYVIPKGGDATRAGGRARRFPQIGRPASAVCRRAGQRHSRLGSRQTADRHGRPVERVGTAGTAVHRRRRARDEPGRRRRHQSGDPGCGGGRQSAVEAAEGEAVALRGSQGGSSAARFPDACHPAPAAHHAKYVDRADAGRDGERQAAAVAAVADRSAVCLSYSGAPFGSRLPARACFGSDQNNARALRISWRRQPDMWALE